MFKKTRRVIVWKSESVVSMEKQEVCLYGMTGNVFVWKGRKYVCDKYRVRQYSVNLNYVVHYKPSTFENFYVKPIIHLNCT